MSRDTRGGLPYGSFSGPYNTIEGDVDAYNTVCVRVAAEYCSMQGMVPGIVVLTCEPCLAFLRTSSGSYRTGVPGRMAPVGSECAGRRRAVSRVPTSPGRRDTGLESKVALWARPSDRRGRPEAAGGRSECSDRSGGPKGSTSGRCSFRSKPSSRRLGRSSGLLYLDSWAEPWRGSRSPRDPGFMNPTVSFI